MNAGSSVRFTTVPIDSVDATRIPNVAVGANSLVAMTPNPAMRAAVASSSGTPVLPAAWRAEFWAVCFRSLARW